MAYITDEQLIDKYGKFCGYMAWTFVKRNRAKGSEPFAEQVDPLLGTEDAEDFAATAMMYLIRIRPEKRDQPPYIKRVIISKIINAWRKRIKELKSEVYCDPVGHDSSARSTFAD